MSTVCLACLKVTGRGRDLVARTHAGGRFFVRARRLVPQGIVRARLAPPRPPHPRGAAGPIWFQERQPRGGPPAEAPPAAPPASDAAGTQTASAAAASRCHITVLQLLPPHPTRNYPPPQNLSVRIPRGGPNSHVVRSGSAVSEPLGAWGAPAVAGGRGGVRDRDGNQWDGQLSRLRQRDSRDRASWPSMCRQTACPVCSKPTWTG